MAIPKIIHYCWFGNNPKSELFKKCIESWKNILPDYEIIEWNESNFDVNCCNYVREAYEAKKWAFVSDYARFYAVHEMGGIYLDTDIEVLKSFDDLLDCGAFFGFGNIDLTVPIFGAEQKHKCIKDVMDEYNTKRFKIGDNKYDMSAIELTVGKVLTNKYELVMNGIYQKLPFDIILYPKEYFMARDYRTGVIKMNPNLHIIHYGEGSWLEDKDRLLLEYQHKFVKLFGEKLGVIIGKSIFIIKYEGIISFINILIRKVKR